jgi:anti-anti-sigma regulatory factor
VIKFEIDQARNLFVIRYHGRVDAAEVETGLEQIRTDLNTLQPGFRLLGDLTKLESMDTACAPFIEKAMDLFNARGVSLIVRVIPDPHRDIGLQIMSIFHYRGDVQILTCETLAQAAELLRE